MDKKGYGEIDFINYTKEGVPFVNRLSLSPSRSTEKGEEEITHYVAMIQSFDNDSAAAAITATSASASTHSQNLNSGSEPPFSSSNEDSTDTSSSSSREKKREKSNNSASSNSSANDDDAVVKILSKIDPNFSEDSSSSDGIEISDGDVTSFLANNSDGASIHSVTSDDARKTSSASAKTAPLAAKFVAARVDLETAWRAAYASAMGHNTKILFTHANQSTSSSGAAAGESSSAASVVQTSSNPSNSTPPPSSPSPTSTPAITSTTTTNTTTTTTTSSTTSTVAGGAAPTFGAAIVPHLNSGIDAFLNFSRGAGAKHSLCLVNRKGNIVHVNSSFVDLTGYKLEECEQKTVKDILWGPATDAFAYQEIWRQVSNTCISNSCVLLSYRKMGEGFLSKIGLYGVGKEYFCLYMEEVGAEMFGASKLEQGLTESANGKIIKIHLVHPRRDRIVGGKGGGTLMNLVEGE